MYFYSHFNIGVLPKTCRNEFNYCMSSNDCTCTYRTTCIHMCMVILPAFELTIK